MMNKNSILPKMILAVALIAGLYGVLPARASEPNPAGKGFLNPDGTLRLDGSFSGALNLQGWDVQLDEKRGPVFSPLPLPLLGDWFGLGTNPLIPNNAGALNGEVYAIAVSGTDVYVGGDFLNVAGSQKASYIAKWDGVTWSNLGDSGITPAWRATPAIRGRVYAIAVIGDFVYIGTEVSSVYINGSAAPQADYIAKWDGTSWSGVGGNGAGGSSLNGNVRTLAVNGNDLYVGGNFTNVKNGLTTLNDADYIAKWDGTNWSALGNNGSGEGTLNSTVYTIAVNGNTVYAGGNFTDVKNGSTTLTAADYIAKWDGANWSAIGNNGGNPVNGSLNNAVYEIAAQGDVVYAGGGFTDVNNVGTVLTAGDYIAKWDGMDWSALGDNSNNNGSLNSAVHAIQIVGTDVYAGGLFVDVNNHGNVLTAADRIAKWDGVNWSALGDDGGAPPNGSINPGSNIVHALAATDKDLYVGGYFRDLNNRGVVLTNGDFIAGYHISDGSYSVYRVAANGSTSASCGLNWSNPCDFQYALNTLTVSGDQIWVKAGTYKPGINRTSTFALKDGVAIYGGFAGTETLLEQRDPTVNVTILSGDLNGNDNDTILPTEPTRAENVLHVVSGTGVGRGAILDGFTITGGNANLDAPTSTSIGGGMKNTSSRPILHNLIFTRNTSSFMGGGMGNEVNSDPFIENVTFENNYAESGGGLANSVSNPTLVDVVFNENRATYGGGVTNKDSKPEFYYITFTRNHAAAGGGGMANENSDPPMILGNVFYQNSASEGGGIHNDNSNPVIYNTTFVKNSAVNGGGAAWNENNSAGALLHVTVAGNESGIENHSSNPLIANSILWGDYLGGGTALITNDVNSNPPVEKSVIQNGYAGGTNIITADPLLGPLGYYGGKTLTIPLQPGSSAIDPGTSLCCLSLDQRGVVRPPQVGYQDFGAYEADGTIIPTVTLTPSITPSPTFTRTPTAINRPDLVITDMRIQLQNTNCLQPGDPLGVRVWIVNNGQSTASTFVVKVNGVKQSVNGLGAGDAKSLFFAGYSNPVTAIVDATGVIAESNENNNSVTQNVPVPTPPLPCTVTPTATQTPTVTATMTKSRTPSPTPTRLRPFMRSQILTPASLTSDFGTTLGSLPSLGLLQQTGAEDDPAAYVSFQTPNTVYMGYQSFTLPPDARTNLIASMLLQVNFKGEASTLWTWSAYDWKSAQWIPLGNSIGAKAGMWKTLLFPIRTPWRFISSHGEIRIQLKSNNASGDAKVDYEALHLTYLSIPATVTPLPTSSYKKGAPFPPTSTP